MQPRKAMKNRLSRLSFSFRLATAGLGLATAGLLQAAEPLQPGQHSASFETEIVLKVHYDYLLYVPEGVAKEPGKKWPAILFLHGSGERGTNVELVATHGPPKIVKDKPDFGFIVISPQCPPDQNWNAEALANLAKKALRDYPIDPDRFYLTGLSMGGYGSWALAAAHPEIFAAVAPICGGGRPSDAPKLKNLPIWVFHGGKDGTVPIKRSQEMVDAVKAAGGNVTFTVYPEAGHDSWTETYNNPELFKWFLEQKRPSR